MPLLEMALASVLERPLPVNRHGFFGLGGRADLLDLGPGSPNDGLSLAAPSWGAPEEPKIEILHGTTTLAFKVRTQPPSRAESLAPAPFPVSQPDQCPRWPRPRSPGGGSGLSSRPPRFHCLIVPGGLRSRSGWRGGWWFSGRRNPRLLGLIPRRAQVASVQERGRPQQQ